MAIGALLGEKHSCLHDYESFFWVLFWICIHFSGPNVKGRVVNKFEKWNYLDTEELATSKLGTVSDEDIFLEIVSQNFTSYHQPLVPWMNRLRRIVFPNGRLRKEPDKGLAARMRKLLGEAQQDSNVLGELGKERKISKS